MPAELPSSVQDRLHAHTPSQHTSAVNSWASADDRFSVPNPAHTQQHAEQLQTALNEARHDVREKNQSLQEVRETLAKFKELEQQLMKQLQDVTTVSFTARIFKDESRSSVEILLHQICRRTNS